MSVQTFTTATTVDDAVAAVAAGARPVAGGTDLVVGARSGKAPMPESVVARSWARTQPVRKARSVAI